MGKEKGKDEASLVDIAAQVKQANLAAYSQVINSTIQQVTAFSGASLVEMQHSNEGGRSPKQVLDETLEGVKAIVDTQDYVLEKALNISKKLEKYAKED